MSGLSATIPKSNIVPRIGGRTPDGIPYLQPEIALFDKAVRLRQ